MEEFYFWSEDFGDSREGNLKESCRNLDRVLEKILIEFEGSLKEFIWRQRQASPKDSVKLHLKTASSFT
jgi:hypothetical protein